MSNITNTTKLDPPFHLLTTMESGGIERQEAIGQKELVNSQQLPSKSNEYSGIDAVEQYGKMGISVLLDGNDNLFLSAILPEGWKKEGTGHPMWSNLIDNKGRIRATIFYKAAFYDREAFVNFIKRYKWENHYTTNEKPEGFEYYPQCYRVMDNGTNQELFRTEVFDAYSDEKLKQQAVDFINNKFPNWDDINAYWD